MEGHFSYQLSVISYQWELPFGKKLQNHALNHRLNQEFQKYFPTCDYFVVIRETSNNIYWFNENLLLCIIEEETYSLFHVSVVLILVNLVKHMKT